MSEQYDPIQISIGIGMENGEGLPSLWLHDDGLIISPEVTKNDCQTIIAILRDTADMVELLMHGNSVGSSAKH